MHPVYCWIEHNFMLIAWINLGISFLYTLFVFNPLTKRWHIMAEE